MACVARNARVIPSVVYTDPEIAWVGLTEDQAKAQGIKVKKGLFPWTASGRAIANGRDEGVTKLLFDDSPEAHGHGKILGGGMVGEIALAIEMGAVAVDIGKTIHPHPMLGESIGMAAEVAHGRCTDLAPGAQVEQISWPPCHVAHHPSLAFEAGKAQRFGGARNPCQKQKSGPKGPLVRKQVDDLLLFHHLFALGLHLFVGLGCVHLFALFHFLVVFHGTAVRGGNRCERNGGKSCGN
jgi:hypothetical protein